MKKCILRIVAILLVLCCTVGLLGCENTVSVKEKDRKPTEETTKTELEATEGGKTVAQGVPGSAELPMIDLCDMTYGQLKTLAWDGSTLTSLENGTWMYAATIGTVAVTCVFENPYEDDAAVVEVMTIFSDNEVAYITEDCRLYDAVSAFPEEVQQQVETMDGGLVVSCILQGKNAQLMFDGTMEDLDNTALVSVQFRREAK